MGKVRRIHVRGKPRKNPDAALLAEAIIQLGRELWAKEQAGQTDTTPPQSLPVDKGEGEEAPS